MADNTLLKLLKKVGDIAALPKKERDKLFSYKPDSPNKKEYTDPNLEEKVKDKLYEVAQLYFAIKENQQSFKEFEGILAVDTRIQGIIGFKTARERVSLEESLMVSLQTIRMIKKDVARYIGLCYLEAEGKKPKSHEECIKMGMQYLESLIEE